MRRRGFPGAPGPGCGVPPAAGIAGTASVGRGRAGAPPPLLPISTVPAPPTTRLPWVPTLPTTVAGLPLISTLAMTLALRVAPQAVASPWRAADRWSKKTSGEPPTIGLLPWPGSGHAVGSPRRAAVCRSCSSPYEINPGTLPCHSGADNLSELLRRHLRKRLGQPRPCLVALEGISYLEVSSPACERRRRTERWRDGEGSLGGGKEAFRAASRSLCLRRGCPPIPRWSDG